MSLAGFPQGAKRAPTTHCSKENCLRATKEGKEFCQEHVEEHPYVKRILSDLANFEKEKQKVLRNKRVIRKGYLEQEIMNVLAESSPVSIEKMVKLLSYDRRIIEVYVKSAQRRKLVSTRKNKRGYLMVTLNNN